MPDAPQTHKGSCLCGTNSFTVKANPSVYVICHCMNCQKVTGSAFMSNGVFKEEDVDLKDCKQVTVYKDSATKSGATTRRHFCTTCGSNMHIYPDPEKITGIVIVPMGLIDGFKGWTPHKEVFHESRCPFVKDLDTKSADEPADPKERIIQNAEF